MPNLRKSVIFEKTQIIASKSLHIKELRNAFAHGKRITVEDLIRFYEKFEDQVKRSTVDWRIYELNKQGVLHRIARGMYSLAETNTYVPNVSRSLKYLYGSIHKQFPYVNICLWTTKWLNEFMVHQPFHFYTILEIEKEVMESVFYSLKDQGKEVFLDPSEEVLDKYVANADEPIILTGLTTESPTQEVNKVITTTLEKMLVDIYCDEKLFGAQQGAELERIYKSAFEKYTISEPKLLRYANRRNKKEEIAELINKTTKKRQ
ncbi:MAG: DUF6577 family protein [Crocinitomicaceae bacterium]